ncbi:hypothetical protein QQM79_00045 [Marinobacteraceae bacterium S3BR75-40.1]
MTEQQTTPGPAAPDDPLATKRYTIGDEVRFQEMMATVRHYSTLRFAILTVFVAINGAVLVQFFDCDLSRQNPDLIGLFRIGGALNAVIFFVFELALNANLTELWRSISQCVGERDGLLSHRKRWKSWAVPCASYGVYVLPLVFWGLFSPDYYPCH